MKLSLIIGLIIGVILLIKFLLPCIKGYFKG